MKFRKQIKKIGSWILTVSILVYTNTLSVFADTVDTAQITSKITGAMEAIQTILQGIIIVVGVCVAIWQCIKKLPQVDNPHEKHELFAGLGKILGLVAAASAMVWVVPWAYNLLVL